tara:strand:- start:19479 stop:19826 length:348 start_codon:yes stop_codon:yes gene_type:complete
MKKTTSIILFFIVLNSLIACSGLTDNKTQSTPQWDFDHQVQFIQTQLNKNNFQLEIIPNNKVKFTQLATFLLRKSYSLCGGYHYKIEMIQGIENYDDKRAMPNYIASSLIAKIAC